MAQRKPINVAEWKAAAKLLKNARRLIERDGWQQGSTIDVRTNCVATALERALKESNYSLVDFNYAREALSQVLNVRRDPAKLKGDPRAVPYWGRELIDWNDKKGRTEREVLDLYARASALADSLSAEAAGHE